MADRGIPQFNRIICTRNIEMMKKHHRDKLQEMGP